MFNIADMALPEFPTDDEAERLIAEAEQAEQNRLGYARQALTASVITPHLFDLVQFNYYGNPNTFMYLTEQGEKGEIDRTIFEDTVLFWRGSSVISSADLVQFLRDEAYATQSPLSLSYFKSLLAELQRYGSYKMGDEFYIKNKFKLFEYLLYLCKAHGIEYAI